MKKIEHHEIITLRVLALSGIMATIFYISHVIGGRIIWVDYNPFIQPISDLTAVTAISKPIATKILWGYDLFNLMFCGVLLIFFGKIYPINKIFYSGMILKTLAELLSTFGFKIFPLADTSWGGSLQNIMHYSITAIIVFSYIVLSILLAYGLAKTKKHPKLTRFLIAFSILFISSGFLTVIATQVLPTYLGLIERVNLYSLMVLNIVLAFWIRSFLLQLVLKSE